jgi:hypothetical protein
MAALGIGLPALLSGVSLAVPWAFAMSAVSMTLAPAFFVFYVVGRI